LLGGGAAGAPGSAEQTAIQHPEGALHFGSEIDVTRGINNIDPVVLPLGGHRGGNDGDQ